MFPYIVATILTLLPQQPLSIWSDPNTLVGLGVGLLGAIATIGAAIYTVRQGRTKRRIDYQLVSDTPIVTVNSTVAGKVQILFNGQPTQGTRVLVLKVRNIGNSSIRKEDYFEPLTFEFDTDVISADVLETTPSSLIKPSARKNFLILGGQNVQFPPFPLNRRDTLTLTILLKDKSAVRVAGRLDQGTISNLSQNRTTVMNIVSAAIVGIVTSIGLAFALLILAAALEGGKVTIPILSITTLVIILGMVLVAVVVAYMFLLRIKKGSPT